MEGNISLFGKELLYMRLIALVHETAFPEMLRPLGVLACQEMALIRPVSLDLACGRLPESLGRSSVSLKFWHNILPRRKFSSY